MNGEDAHSAKRRYWRWDALSFLFTVSIVSLIVFLGSLSIFFISISFLEKVNIDAKVSFSALVIMLIFSLWPGFVVSLGCPFYIVGLRRGGPRCRLYEGLTIVAALLTALAVYVVFVYRNIIPA